MSVCLSGWLAVFMSLINENSSEWRWIHKAESRDKRILNDEEKKWGFLAFFRRSPLFSKLLFKRVIQFLTRSVGLDLFVSFQLAFVRSVRLGSSVTTRKILLGRLCNAHICLILLNCNSRNVCWDLLRPFAYSTARKSIHTSQVYQRWFCWQWRYISLAETVGSANQLQYDPDLTSTDITVILIYYLPKKYCDTVLSQ